MFGMAQPSAAKRGRMEDEHMDGIIPASPRAAAPRASPFVRVAGAVFMSESYKADFETLYLPLRDAEMYVNTAKYDRISFVSGPAFIGTAPGSYLRTVTGYIVNFWLFDPAARASTVALSLCFEHEPDALRLRAAL
eukprot:m.274674 g.274674  ORF g.274674 m.274674 type:complete len:136 (-) comp49701_c0_seq1:53-460(-)